VCHPGFQRLVNIVAVIGLYSVLHSVTAHDSECMHRLCALVDDFTNVITQRQVRVMPTHTNESVATNVRQFLRNAYFALRSAVAGEDHLNWFGFVEFHIIRLDRVC